MEKGTEIGFEIGYGKGYRTHVCLYVYVYMLCIHVQLETSEMGLRCDWQEV